jgi:hypothetical protein
MKNGTKVLSIALLLSLSIILVSCGNQKSEWKGIIEKENGVTVVKNPKEPIHKEDVFILEEELSIGNGNKGEEYSFFRIGNIAVDDIESIYVADIASAHIRVFDSDGKYLRTIGRKGQGPGEMQMPSYVQITSNNEVLVQDYMAQRLSFFSVNGKYLRQISTAKTRTPFIPIKMDSQGNLIVFAASAPPPVGGKELRIYDPNLELLMIIAKEERGTRGIFDIGKSSLYCDVSPSNNIVWGDSKEYVLQILNQRGDLIKKIIKEYNPIEITAEDKEKYEKQYAGPVKRGMRLNFRGHFPAFSEISVDDEERIFVKTYERVECREDVFEAEGKYIAKVPIQANLNRDSIWKNNKLYTIEEDEEGYQVVKRYKVSWRY